MVRYAGNEASMHATGRLVAFTAYTQIIHCIVPTQIEVETGAGRKGVGDHSDHFPSFGLDDLTPLHDGAQLTPKRRAPVGGRGRALSGPFTVAGVWGNSVPPPRPSLPPPMETPEFEGRSDFDNLLLRAWSGENCCYSGLPALNIER